MAKPRREVLVLVLCLLLRIVHNHLAMDDTFTVDGAVDHNATLPCSITITSNWKDEQLQVIWFKNFTEKLWDCVVKIKKAPHCQMSPNSSRTQISRTFGKADLEISALQESDAGEYQCWIILSDAYYRRDILLRVHGVHSNGQGKNTSRWWWRLMGTVSSWTIFLLSGWPVAIFLAGLLLTKGLGFLKRKRKYQLRNLI
ncbi:uncharacterized protein RB166_015776 [Leptodactylus fuscus]